MQRGGQFHEKALPLANQLLQKLEAEHVREVEAMYMEQLTLRQELQRVTDLMVTEMIPREKQIHDAMEKMNAAYAQATQHLHAHVGSMSTHVSGVSGSHHAKRKELLDPLADTERELRRIQELLARPPVVPPDLPSNIAQKSYGGGISTPSRLGGSTAYSPGSIMSMGSTPGPAPYRPEPRPTANYGSPGSIKSWGFSQGPTYRPEPTPTAANYSPVSIPSQSRSPPPPASPRGLPAYSQQPIVAAAANYSPVTIQSQSRSPPPPASPRGPPAYCQRPIAEPIVEPIIANGRRF